MDQIIQHDGRAPRAFLPYESSAILKHHQAGGLVCLVLRRNVYPVIVHRDGKNLASLFVLGDSSFGYARLRLGIGAKRIFIGARKRAECK
jgi:hypothetical protein